MSFTNPFSGHGGPRTSTISHRSDANAIGLPHNGATPREMFAHTLEHPLQFSKLTMASARMVRYDKPDEILIYACGQAILTDSGDKRAGCAVVFETQDNPLSNPVAFSLEQNGVWGGHQSSTPFAAALRALVAALELKTWGSEGWKQVTIATDNKDVYNGITSKVSKWYYKGWLDEGAKQHPPRPELWRRALELISEQADHGCEVKLLLITTEQNQHAADLARKVAPSDSVSQHYQSCGDVGLFSGAALEADG